MKGRRGVKAVPRRVKEGSRKGQERFKKGHGEVKEGSLKGNRMQNHLKNYCGVKDGPMRG